MVEGLADGGFALISKTHHSLVDGVSGVDLMTTLFDLDPHGPRRRARRPGCRARARPTPQLAATALQDTVGRAATLPLRALAALRGPPQALEEAREATSASARSSRGA